MSGLVFVDIETTARFDTIGAARAVFSPVNPSKLSYAMESTRSWNRINVIAIGH